MGIGPTLMTMDITLIIHAVGALLIVEAVSWNCLNRCGCTTAMQNPLIFTSFVIFMNFFLVSWIIMGSIKMLTGMIGGWLPLALLFGATCLTGLCVDARDQTVPAVSGRLSTCQ